MKDKRTFFIMNQKGFINIILVVIVVALVGAGVYFVSIRQTPTPNPSPSSSPSVKTSPTQKSGIKGTVVGHYCSGVQPVEPSPNYQPCGEKLLASLSLKIKNDISGIEKQVTTDSAGKFQVELSPGKYTINQASESQYIIGGPFSVEVKSGVFTETQLKFEALLP